MARDMIAEFKNQMNIDGPNWPLSDLVQLSFGEAERDQLQAVREFAARLNYVRTGAIASYRGPIGPYGMPSWDKYPHREEWRRDWGPWMPGYKPVY